MVGWRQVSNGLYYLSLSQLRALRDVRNMRSQAGNGSGSELNLISPKSINKVNPLNLLHERCGHAGVTTLLSGIKNGVFSDSEKFLKLLKDATFDFCPVCAKSKMKATPHKPSSTDHSKDTVGSHFSIDLCGPFSVDSYGGNKYFMTFTCRKTKRVFIYFLRNKDDAIDILKTFVTEVKAKYGAKDVRIIRSDNGGEFTSAAFARVLENENIWHELTQAYSPEQNGTAERVNGKILTMVRCMLHSARLPKNMWAEAAEYAVYILNCMPHTSLPEHITPMEAWTNVKPQLDSLFVWGSPAYALIPHKRRKDKKLGETSVNGVIVGVSRDRKGFRIYVPSLHSIFESNDVEIDEHIIIKRTQEARDVAVEGTGDGGVADPLLFDDDISKTLTLPLSEIDTALAKPPPPTTPAAAPTAATPMQAPCTPSTPPTKLHVRTPPTASRPPIMQSLSPSTPHRAAAVIPPNAPPPVPIPPLTSPNHSRRSRLEEVEETMDEERTAPARRSTRVRSQPERFGDIYADEKETQWRK